MFMHSYRWRKGYGGGKTGLVGLLRENGINCIT